VHYVTTHADKDPFVRLYPYHTYTEATDRMAFIHTRLEDDGYVYQRSDRLNEQRVRIYAKTGENMVYMSYQDG